MWLNFLVSEVLPRDQASLHIRVECGLPWEIWQNASIYEVTIRETMDHKLIMDFFSYCKSLVVFQIIEFLFIVPRQSAKIQSNVRLFSDIQLGHIFILQSLWEKYIFIHSISMKELIYLQKKINIINFSI